MTDASLLERARSALGRALRLTQALGAELDQAAQSPPAGAGPAVEISQPARSDSSAGTGTGRVLTCIGSSEAAMGPSDPAMSPRMLPTHQERASTHHAAVQSDDNDSGEESKSDECWWEQRDGSSISSSDCALLQLSPTAEAAHASTQSPNPLHDCSQMEAQFSGQQVGECQQSQASSSNRFPAGQFSSSQHEEGSLIRCTTAVDHAEAVDASHTTSCSREHSEAADDGKLLEKDAAACSRSSQPVDQIAQRLGVVQRQQADTVSQLLQLRQVCSRSSKPQRIAVWCMQSLAMEGWVSCTTFSKLQGLICTQTALIQNLKIL